MFLFLLLADIFLLSSPFQLRPCSVTTVDSGSKALELLGLRDEAAESSSPSSSPDHQVGAPAWWIGSLSVLVL